MIMDRCKTGIANLDNMVGGGLPRGSVIGIAGPPGTGKTLLSLQFLLEGAENKEKGYYITLQEPVRNLERAYEALSWGKRLAAQRKKGRLLLKHLPYAEFEGNIEAIVDEVLADKNAHRLVIDSLDGLIEFMRERNRGVRGVLDPLFARLRRDDLTTIVVMEGSGEDDRFGVERYLVDGVISLELLAWGELEKRIFVPKMRWTKQHTSSQRYEITDDGLTIESVDPAFDV